MGQQYRPSVNYYDTNPEDLYVPTTNGSVNTMPKINNNVKHQSISSQLPKCNLGSIPEPRNPYTGEPLYERSNLYTMPTQDTLANLENDINCLFDDCAPSNSSNKVDSSFSKDDYVKPIINTGNLIVNNLKKKEKQEYIEEHMLVVDSGDRNIVKFPNPFDYRVYFNSQYDDANIQRIFEHVKSISLETAVLPDKYYFTKTNIPLIDNDVNIIKIIDNTLRNTSIELSSIDISGTFFIIDVNDVLNETRYTRKIKFALETAYPDMILNSYEYTFTFDQSVENGIPSDICGANPIYPESVEQYSVQNVSLMKNKYNILNIDEFTYVNEFSTSDALAKSFAVLFMDTKCNNAHYAKTKMKGKVFNDDTLGTINRLSIRLCDHTGIQLKNSYENYLDYEVPRNKLCTCFTDSDGTFKRDYRCSCSYFRHPHYHPFQNTLIFKITTWEQMLNTEIF